MLSSCPYWRSSAVFAARPIQPASTTRVRKYVAQKGETCNAGYDEVLKLHAYHRHIIRLLTALHPSIQKALKFGFYFMEVPVAVEVNKL